MTPEAQIAMWGVATVAPLILNLLTKAEADAVGLAFMILAAWLLGRIFGALYAPPVSMQWYPIVDAVSGALAFYAWQARPEPWKLAVTGLLVVQCSLHAAFWISGPEDETLIRYLVANNTLFALQLLCVASPGGRHVARYLGAWMSRVARSHYHAGARAP